MSPKFAVTLLAMLFATSSLAQAKSESEEKVMALTVLKKYSETVACDTNFKEEKSVQKFLKDVYTIERDPELGSATYFILWSGDIGCNGGSGTNSFIISEVSRFTESRPLLVQNNDAFGGEFSKSINPRFIEKIQQINEKKFLITSSEHSGDDANNFPSKKYQYTLEQKDYKWKLTNKKYLGKNN
jgi:hypothetical protein